MLAVGCDRLIELLGDSGEEVRREPGRGGGGLGVSGATAHAATAPLLVNLSPPRPLRSRRPLVPLPTPTVTQNLPPAVIGGREVAPAAPEHLDVLSQASRLAPPT